MHAWQTRSLSPGGKEVLLKAIAMALPTYTMACFLLPKTLIKKIMVIMADFWWKNKKDSRGMHWKNWDQLAQPKSVGVLGFKDLEAFNLALLGKQLWRMIIHKDSLMTRMFKSRYFAKTDPLSAGLGSRSSYAWRSVHAAQNLIKQGARVVIGNGRDTNVWQEQWLGRKPARQVTKIKADTRLRNINLPSNMKVCELMIHNSTQWNSQLLQCIFPEDERKKIMSIRSGGRITKDTYC